MSEDGSLNATFPRAYFLQSCAAILAAAILSFLLLPPLPALFSSLLAALAIWIAVVDLEYLIIPDLASAAMAALGLLLVIIETPAGARLEALGDALLRAIIAGGFLLLVRFVFLRFADKEGLGLGDVKLMAGGATFLSWVSLPYSVVLAAFAAMLVIGLRALRHGTRIDREAEIPFGAFLAPGVWLAFVLERLYLL
jgi:prepilin signal peptidase PulO-like enzyme (type II secretory pathway)